VQNAKLALYTDDTNIPMVDKDIKVFELKTALIIIIIIKTDRGIAS
jgi:hypothetical protein